jgi:Cu(I)/Ag(I) efflux system membrane fusion protein
MDNVTTRDRIPGFYLRHRGKFWLAQAVLLLGIGTVVGMSLGGHSMPDGSAAPDPHAGHQTKNEDAPTIWTCSMHPQIRRDGPGKCPICAMDLVPVKKSAVGVRTISISADVKKLMNVQTVPVQRRYVTADVRMVGKIDYDETRLAHITAWVSGRLDRLYVDYTGVEVKKGDHMVYIYSEELYTAQEELIVALESNVEGTSRFIEPLNLVESSREKLRLLGLTPEQIQEIEQRRKPTYHITIYSPVGGIVIEKLKQEGDRVRTGDRIYTVADLRQLWVMLDAYESDMAWLRYGQEVEFSTEAYPGEVFKGRVAFTDRVLNKETRTFKVRVNISNEDGRLKPEMFVRAVVRSDIASGGRVLDASLAGKWISPMHPEIVKDEPGNCDVCGMPLVRAETLGYVTAEPADTAKPLVIPVSAALITGRRAIVYVQVPTAEEPTYEGREIVLGPRAGDYYLVRSGLTEGELVVTNGNFKLDSALQISAKPSMMTPEGGGGGGVHNHGGEPMKGGDDKPMSMSEHAAMSLPKQLQMQLHQTLESVEAVGVAIESAELTSIRKAFGQLGERVAAVDADQLNGDMKMQWQEFAMLLRNDAVEGSQITTLQHADEVFLVTKRHAERVQETFGLTHAGHEMDEQSLEVSDEFRTELARMLPPYLAIGDALASDDVRNISGVIGGLDQAINAINSQSLSGNSAQRWQAELKSLSAIIARLDKANDIASLRSAFALLSDQLLTLQRTFGIQQSDQLFEMHCPMAFEGRGATWIQADAAVRNPYYGATMLKCADRVSPLSPASP